MSYENILGKDQDLSGITMLDAVRRILAQAWHGRRHQTDEALDSVRDQLAEVVSEDAEGMLDDVIDGIRWGVVAGRARGTSKTMIRVVTPDGMRLTYELHATADEGIVRAVLDAINGGLSNYGRVVAAPPKPGAKP